MVHIGFSDRSDTIAITLVHMKADRISIDLTNLRERVENTRNDSAWKALSLSKKVRILLEERLDEIEREAKIQKEKHRDDD
jgi:hypothetical protein